MHYTQITKKNRSWGNKGTYMHKGKFFFRRYYGACQLAINCKHFTAPEHFSVHRNSKMFAKIGDLTSTVISSEKNLPLQTDSNSPSMAQDICLIIFQKISHITQS